MFVIYSSCNFLLIILIMEVKLLPTETAARWKQIETSGRIVSVPNSLFSFLLALQQDLGFSGRSAFSLLLHIYFVKDLKTSFQNTSFRELPPLAYAYLLTYIWVQELYPFLNRLFQSYGYTLAYIKMHNISLPHLYTCLGMHVHNVEYNWLIFLQRPDLHMQLLISVQQMHTCIFISQSL